MCFTIISLLNQCVYCLGKLFVDTRHIINSTVSSSLAVGAYVFNVMLLDMSCAWLRVLMNTLYYPCPCMHIEFVYLHSWLCIISTYTHILTLLTGIVCLMNRIWVTSASCLSYVSFSSEISKTYKHKESSNVFTLYSS